MDCNTIDTQYYGNTKHLNWRTKLGECIHQIMCYSSPSSLSRQVHGMTCDIVVHNTLAVASFSLKKSILYRLSTTHIYTAYVQAVSMTIAPQWVLGKSYWSGDAVSLATFRGSHSNGRKLVAANQPPVKHRHDDDILPCTS